VEREQREQDFWGHNIPSIEQCVADYHLGPDLNTEAMLQAVGPVADARILDFACGAGVTTAWLAARGADVVGLDLTEPPLERAAQVLERLGLQATFTSTDLDDASSLGRFDAIVGRYALHHTDVATIAPLLADRLRPGGKAAFVETFSSNPVLRFARGHLIGRLGIPRLGTLDEKPLDRADVAALAQAFGEALIEVRELRFLRILDRQVFRYRHGRLSSVLAAADDGLHRVPGTDFLSYHQVVVLTKNG
jgi:2-polyprenyl-3-methyl-5-hydroxy-6-metoxy-1,4-benzoquinol methylase